MTPVDAVKADQSSPALSVISELISGNTDVHFAVQLARGIPETSRFSTATATADLSTDAGCRFEW